MSDLSKLVLGIAAVAAPFMGHAQSSGGVQSGTALNTSLFGGPSASEGEIAYTTFTKGSNPKMEYARGAAAFSVLSRETELGNYKLHYPVDGRDVNAEPENAALIIQARALLQGNPNARIEIFSSTSSTGSAEYNQQLSQDRSNAVFKALELAGIPPSRLSIVNVGEEKALEATGDGVEHDGFRSTAIRVVEGEEKVKSRNIAHVHVVYVDPQRSPDFSVFHPQEKYWEQLEANHPDVKIVRKVPKDIYVVDVSQNSGKLITITLDGLSQEIIDNMTVATYDASGGRSLNIARIREGGGRGLVVEALDASTGTWETVANVSPKDGQDLDLSKIKTTTVGFDGAVVDVARGEIHVASQPTVHPGQAYNTAIPAALP